MNTRLVAVVVVVLVVLATAVGGLLLVLTQPDPDSFESSYGYSVGLYPQATLDNVTLYLPVPLEDGESELGELFVETVVYDRHLPSVVGYDPDPAPVNFTYALVETEHGPMLAITADRIEVTRVYFREVGNETTRWHERIDEEEYDPSNPAHGVKHDGSFRFSVRLPAEYPVDTRAPLTGQPTLSPQYDRVEAGCHVPNDPEETCFDYETRAFASYETAPSAEVGLDVTTSGSNTWFAGGWNGNRYRDHVMLGLDGPQDGWVVARGDLDTGQGTYPTPEA